MPYTSLLLVIVTIFFSVTAQHFGSLWCHEGDVKSYSPNQCAEKTLECFKFECVAPPETRLEIGINAADFSARGCGVSLANKATGLKNESCYQAMAVCQYLGGIGECYTCSDKHMCNADLQIYRPGIFVILLVFYIIFHFS